MIVEPIAVETADRWTLRGDRRGAGPAVAVLGHAMFVDRRTLDRPSGEGLASELVAAGLEVLTFDARGHGQSGPGADTGASWTYDDVVRLDVPAMVAAARSLAGGRPVVLVGHSLIGHAALIHAGLEPARAADGIVALAPNLWAPHLEPSAPRRAAKAAALRAWSAITEAAGCFDPRPLRLGTTPEARGYVAQFRAMWERDRLESPDGEVDYEAALARALVPVLAYSSDADRLFGHPGSVGRFLALMGRAPVEHRRLTLDGGAPSHAGFVTSTASRPIWRDIGSWALGFARR